jgi:hypothetical protein
MLLHLRNRLKMRLDGKLDGLSAEPRVARQRMRQMISADGELVERSESAKSA